MTKPIKRRIKSDRPNYVIIGKGGKIVVLSGSTGKISDLPTALADDVIDLVSKRQKLGIDLTKLLKSKKFDLDLSDQGSVHIDEDKSEDDES